MKKLFSELSPAEVSWSISYVCIAWMGELGNGAIQTITGPMQPFLAYNLQTNTQTINLVWTLGFLGFLFGSLITSHIFTKYLVTSVRKLLFLSLVMLLTGLATLSLPFMNNMPLLLLARFFQVRKYQNIINISIKCIIVSQLRPLSDCRQHPAGVHAGP